MEVLNVKIEENILKEIDDNLEKHRYSTRSEFVRDAIRDKLSELEKDDLMKNAADLRGASKHHTTDEQLDKVREKLSAEFEKRFK